MEILLLKKIYFVLIVILIIQIIKYIDHHNGLDK